MANLVSPLGGNLGEADASPRFKVGTCGQDEAGNIYRYVQADGMGVTGPGYVVLLDPADWLDADLIDTTNAASKEDRPVGVSPIAVAADQYFWVQICGPCNIRVSANAAADAVLNVTATAGVLDDDATAGAEVIKHAVLTSANGGAEAVAAGYIDHPLVGATL